MNQRHLNKALQNNSKAYKVILRQSLFWMAILNLNKVVQNNSKRIQSNLKTILVPDGYSKLEQSLPKPFKKASKAISVQDGYPKFEQNLPKAAKQKNFFEFHSPQIQIISSIC